MRLYVRSWIHLTQALSLSVLFLAAPKVAASSTNPYSFPDQRGTLRGDTNIVEYFDWQDAWGTVHLNTDADGMQDPGTPALKGTDPESSGRLPCREGAKVCDQGKTKDLFAKVNMVNKIAQRHVGHAIKYDIKNSLANCMSRVIPNSPIFNGGDGHQFQSSTCRGYGLPLRAREGRPLSLIYMPLWERNANKDNCLQEVINNCTQDVFSCGTTNDTAGSGNPIEHVFTKSDIEKFCGDAGGCRMPNTYYRYKRDGKFHVTLNPMDENLEDISNWQEVKNKSEALKRIRAFDVKLGKEFKSDVKSLLVVDPSDFFDLRDYVRGGRYDSGYKEIDEKTGLPKTPDTCPILGVTGYGGICDPSGKAGCNLPVYGVGEPSTFTDANGHTSTVDHYPLKWSGYVKAWKFISVDEYVAMTDLRVAERGARLYAPATKLNDNPILMVKRADDYCDRRERYSRAVNPAAEPDLPCIQFKQYQALEREGMAPMYTFVDLFQPEADIGIKQTHSLKILLTHDRKDNLPVGRDRNASFLDEAMPQVMITENGTTRRKDAVQVLDYENKNAQVHVGRDIASWLVERGSMSSDDVRRTMTLGITDASARRTGIPNRGEEAAFPVEPGMKACFRLPSPSYKDGDLTPYEVVGGLSRKQLDESFSLKVVRGQVKLVTESGVEKDVKDMSPSEFSSLGYTLTKDCVKDVFTNECKEDEGQVWLHHEVDGMSTPYEVNGNLTRSQTEASFSVVEKNEKVYVVTSDGEEVLVPNLSPRKVVLSGFTVTKDKARDGGKTWLHKNTSRCVCVTHEPDASHEELKETLFVPSKSQNELEKFVKNAPNVTNRVTSVACRPEYATYRQLTLGTNLPPARAAQIKRQERAAERAGRPFMPNPNGTLTWQGTLSCDALRSKPSCNETKIITAQRRCMLEDGIAGTCGDCLRAGDPDKDRVSFAQADVAGSGLAEIMRSPATGDACFFQAACFSVASAGCPAVGASGGHIFCVSGETMITLADGSQKAIKDIDPTQDVSVLSFNSNEVAGEAYSSKVKELVITKNQRVLRVPVGEGDAKTHLRITPDHRVMLESGLMINANDIQKGDVLINGYGLPVLVSGDKVFEDDPITVYNLVLERDTDGYVAGGVRVTSYPGDK